MKTRLLRVHLTEAEWALLKELAEVVHFRTKQLGKPQKLNVSGIVSLIVKQELLRNGEDIGREKEAMGIHRAKSRFARMAKLGFDTFDTDAFFHGTDIRAVAEGSRAHTTTGSFRSVPGVGLEEALPGYAEVPGEVPSTNAEFDQFLDELLEEPDTKRTGTPEFSDGSVLSGSPKKRTYKKKRATPKSGSKQA